eukprot:SAG31_NODE_3193_length_4570_cov_1.411449_1_plen_183_part_00
MESTVPPCVGPPPPPPQRPRGSPSRRCSSRAGAAGAVAASRQRASHRRRRRRHGGAPHGVPVIKSTARARATSNSYMSKWNCILTDLRILPVWSMPVYPILIIGLSLSTHKLRVSPIGWDPVLQAENLPRAQGPELDSASSSSHPAHHSSMPSGGSKFRSTAVRPVRVYSLPGRIPGRSKFN